MFVVCLMKWRIKLTKWYKKEQYSLLIVKITTRFVSYTLGKIGNFCIWTWTCKELCSFLLCIPCHFWPNCPVPASVHLGITSKIFTEDYCARPFSRLPICHDTQTGAKVSNKTQLLADSQQTLPLARVPLQGAQHKSLHGKGSEPLDLSESGKKYRQPLLSAGSNISSSLWVCWASARRLR